MPAFGLSQSFRSRRGNSRSSAATRLLAILFAIALHGGLIWALLEINAAISVTKKSSDLRNLAEISIAIPSSNRAESAPPSPPVTRNRAPARPRHSVSRPAEPAEQSDGGGAFGINAGAETTADNAPNASLTGSSADMLIDLSSAFRKKLLAHVQTFQHYPQVSGGKKPQGTVEVLFTMDRNGVILGVWLKDSSGSDALDREAVQTILRAQPLPRIPVELPDPLNISLPIAFDPAP